jgi:hypothetical protein
MEDAAGERTSDLFGIYYFEIEICADSLHSYGIPYDEGIGISDHVLGTGIRSPVV